VGHAARGQIALNGGKRFACKMGAKFIVGVADPDDRYVRAARSPDEYVDGAEHFLASIGVRDDAVLKIDDDERGIWTIDERSHGYRAFVANPHLNEVRR